MAPKKSGTAGFVLLVSDSGLLDPNVKLEVGADDVGAPKLGTGLSSALVCFEVEALPADGAAGVKLKPPLLGSGSVL